MKKLLSKISVAAFIAAMSLICGCSNPGTSSSTPDSTPSACEHTGGTATCTEKAICETCGEAYGEALGHEAAAEWTITTEATCVAKGEQVKTCTREGCGEVVETEEIAINPDNHTAGEWTTKTEATCTTAGEKVKLCTNEGCGAEVETEEIAALDHEVPTDWTVKTPATCTEAGEQVKNCTREGCGAQVASEPIAALNHEIPTDWTVKTPATCTEAGEQVKNCTRVGCGAEVASEPIAALDHEIPTEWSIKTEATCVAEGEQVKNCTRVGCGAQVASEPIAIDPDKHEIPADWEIAIPATCTEDGEQVKNCTRVGCGVEVATETIKAFGHSYDTVTARCVRAKDCFSFFEKVVPVVDKAYIFGMAQGNINNTIYYLKGGMDGYYMATTTNPEEALQIYLEATTGGYYAYCYVGEVKTYINMVVSGTHVNGKYETTASTVYTIDEEHHTLIGVVNDTDYWFSTRNDNTYTTVGPNKTSYNGFYCEFYSLHEHEHTIEGEIITPATSCQEDGKGEKEMFCACGHVSYEPIVLAHIDENLDVDCDYEGCTTRIAPPADSTLSNFTANNLGSKLSTSSNYYVEGTIVEVLDARNGIFLIDDGTGEKFYFRLPKNADGVSHASWEVKLTTGDKVQVYGKINKFSSSTAPNGQYWPAMQAPVVTILEQHPHDFTYSPATCSKPAFCACGQSYGAPLGCADTDGDELCDDCGKNVNYIYEYVEIRTDNNSGVVDESTYTWNNDNFNVQVFKGGSSQLYTTAKDHMRLYKGNQFALTSKNGLVVKTVTVYLTNETQIANFEKFLTGYTYTKDTENYSITIETNFTETLTFTNPDKSTQIKGVEFGYEKPNA